jgi:lipopolysaccharide/colanic/teichoic acid biosynthesis glycosyltransferase
MTGLWQVSGINRVPFDEMVRIDIDYIEKRSLALDSKILLKTALRVLRMDGSYQRQEGVTSD